MSPAAMMFCARRMKSGLVMLVWRSLLLAPSSAAGFSSALKLRIANPETLIDINDLDELKGVSIEGGALRIGAMVRHTELLESPLAVEHFPILVDAERVIADPVVRNRGTIGGSLCQADPAEDLTTVCDVLRARVVIAGHALVQNIRRGHYELAVEEPTNRRLAVAFDELALAI